MFKFFGDPWRKEDPQMPSMFSCLMTEFFCTALLVFIGTSLCAVGDLATGDDKLGAFTPFAWGFTVIVCVQLGFRTSGAHINPAISLLEFVSQKISFTRFVLYTIVQIAGGFIGAAMTFIIYYDLINNFDGGIRQVYGEKRTAHIFATYPKPYLTLRGGLVDQIMSTMTLCILLQGITRRRHGVPKHFQPYLVGTAVSLLSLGYSENCMCAMNPARDLGPRIFTLIAGYGWEVFSYRDYGWFFVPIIGPCIGALLGGGLYKIFVGNFVSELPDDYNIPKPKRRPETLTTTASSITNEKEEIISVITLPAY
jgi:MIP family channel proteins